MLQWMEDVDVMSTVCRLADRATATSAGYCFSLWQAMG